MNILQKPKYQFAIFLLIFMIINLLQSNYTALLRDEAYYWVWSKNLAFGYFDHPPMVALWIKISSFFSEGELGVRFFSSISFSIMLIFIWLIIDNPKKEKYVWLYFLVIISMAFFNVYGFITTPDTPLLLFVALFLLSYKQFLENESWINILLLGFSMSAMLYSKYHGILVIFFVVLSNFSLLKNKKFWIAGLFAIVLFIPHLYWQYINDFPTFKYHLFERTKKGFKIEYSLMHLVNQIAIVGITFPLIYYSLFKYKSKNKFERSLKFIIYGFILFFLYSSFSINTQAQWTVVILIPLIIISFNYFVQNKKLRKWLIIIGLIQFVIMLVARVFLADENISPIQLEPHIAKTWIPELKEKTNNKPIVFINSFANASLYKFYTGINTHSYSVLRGRKSQYDLFDFEDKMQNKNIYAVGKLLPNAPFLVKQRKTLLNGFPIEDYTTFQKVKCIIEKDHLSMSEGEKLNFEFKFINTYHKNINFDHVRFIGVFQDKKNKILAKVPIDISDLKSLKSKEEKLMKATMTVPQLDKKENISFRVALEFYDTLEGYQGNKIQPVFVNRSSSL